MGNRTRAAARLGWMIVLAMAAVAARAQENINTPAHFPDPEFRRIVEEKLGAAPGGPFTAERAASATGALQGARRGVADLRGLEYLQGVTELQMAENQLASADFSQNPGLRVINLFKNQLTNLDVGGNGALRRLLCHNNRLASLDVSNNPNLEYLECDNNSLTVLDVSANPNLEYLDCNGNGMSELTLAAGGALRELYCFRNALTRLDADGLPDLTVLDCSFNPIATLGLADAASLETLECHDNALTELDLSGALSIRTIRCHNNQIASIRFPPGPLYTLLECHHNRLETLDVSDNPHLQSLFCHHNGMRELRIPAESTGEGLIQLDCGNNELEDISGLTANPSLGNGPRGLLNARFNNLDCGDWQSVTALRGQVGDPVFFSFAPDVLQRGFAFSPQNGLDPYDCPTGVTDWLILN